MLTEGLESVEMRRGGEQAKKNKTNKKPKQRYEGKRAKEGLQGHNGLDASPILHLQTDHWTIKPAAQMLFSLDFSQGKLGPDFHETVIVSREL